MSQRIALWGLVAGLLFMATGCTLMDARPTRGKIPARIEIAPETNNTTNPTNTQHTFIATVTDAEGRPVPDARVEWVLQRHMCQVGDIVEVDDQGCPCSSAKLTNTYAVGSTARNPYTLPNGITIHTGQTWLTITSSFPGTTNVIAFAPGIRDWRAHKVYGVKYWGPDYDMVCTSDTGCVGGDPGRITVRITDTAGAPAEGYRVRFGAGSNGATPSPSEGVTGPDGTVSATVTSSTAGPVTVPYHVVPPARQSENCCCPTPQASEKDGQCVVEFGAAALVCDVTPNTASLCPGDTAEFRVTVTNTGSCDAMGVNVTANTMGCGSIISGNCNLGVIPVGGSRDCVVTASSAGCSEGQMLGVQATVSASNAASTNCAAQIPVMACALTCSMVARTPSVCPGDNAQFEITITNTSSCDAVGVGVDLTTSGCAGATAQADGQTQGLTIPAGGSVSMGITAMTGNCPPNSTVTVMANVTGACPTSCQASANVGSISLTCTKTASPSGVEIGTNITFNVTVTNTSSCPITLANPMDQPGCGTITQNGCSALAGQVLSPSESRSCAITLDTNGCTAGSFTNVFTIDASAGGASASTRCEVPFAVRITPAMECFFQDTIDPIYVGEDPSTTELVWNYVNQRHTLEGVIFQFRLPPQLQLDGGADAINLTGAAHFDAGSVRITAGQIEMTANRSIGEGEQGEIRIRARAVSAGAATTRGFWTFQGYGDWVEEDTGTRVIQR